MNDRTIAAEARLPPLASPAPFAGLSPFAGMDVASLLVSRAQIHADSPFLIWAPFDAPERTWTYAGFLADVTRLAGGLQARGIRPGDRVLVHLENCPETLLIRFACAWIGAIAVITHAQASGPELREMIETSGARAAVTQPRLADLVSRHAPLSVEWIAVTHSDAGEPAASRTLPERAGRFETLLGQPAAQPVPDPTQPALILFTTGSTGRAKAVLWTQENLLWAASLGARQQGFRPADVAQICLPLSDVMGFSWTFLPVLWVGGTALVQPRFSAARFWTLAQRHHATISPQLPDTLAALDAQPVPARHDFRFWIVNRQLPEAQQQFGIPAMVSAWGMTEMVAQPILGVPGEGALAGQTMGRPAPGYTIRIVAESGADVAPGDIGELLVGGIRGRSIFREYYNNPQANAEAFTGDGFFRTGDRVRQLADGSILFVDRIRDAMTLGGEGVSALEIEAVIRQVPGVVEVAVVPRADTLRGEVPVAFVVLEREGAPDETRAAILQQCRAGMARVKVPQEIRFVEALPRDGFGQIAKGKLRALLGPG